MTFHLDNLRTCGAAVVAALLLAVTGCQNAAPGPTAVIGEPASSTASPEPDPMAGAPALGTCYEMTRRAARAVSHDGSGVSCSAPHTSMTYYVGQFPADAVGGEAQAAFRGCVRNLHQGVGLTSKELKSSILTWIWFESTTAEWSAGARWFRCDVIAEQGNGALKPLPPGGPPYFADGVPDDYFRCMRQRGEVGVPVTCDKPHDYRWAGTFEGTGRRLPTRARLLELAQQHCYAIAGTETWWVTWPGRDAWAAGDHEMACYRRTSS